MNTLKNVRPIERITESLKKAKVLQDHLNAFVIFQDDHALEKQAQESEQRHEQKLKKSALDGLPIGIKDNFCTKNLRTTCCSRMLEPFVPKYNATVVDRTEKAGGIVLGQAYYMFSRFLILQFFFSRNFPCFDFLQGRIFLLRSKMLI